MPTTRLETEVVITARDQTGQVFDKVISKVERVSALLANLGFAKDTLNRIAESFKRIFTEANAGVRAIDKVKGSILELDQVNRNLSEFVTMTDIDNVNNLDSAVDGLQATWLRLGVVINRGVNPVITTFTNLMNTAFTSIVDFVERGINRLTGNDGLNLFNEALQNTPLNNTPQFIDSVREDIQTLDSILNGARFEIQDFQDQLDAFQGSRFNQNRDNRFIQSILDEIEARRQVMDVANQRIEQLKLVVTQHNNAAEAARRAAQAEIEALERIAAAERSARLDRFENNNPIILRQASIDEQEVMSQAVEATPLPDDAFTKIKTQQEEIATCAEKMARAVRDAWRTGAEAFSTFIGAFENDVGAYINITDSMTESERANAEASNRINRKRFNENKKFAKAQAAISAAVGISRALELPWPANLAAAAQVAATAFAQIRAINQTSFGNPSTAEVSGGGDVNNNLQNTPNIGDINSQRDNRRLVVNLNGRRGYDAEDVTELIQALNDFDTGLQIDVNRVGV